MNAAWYIRSRQLGRAARFWLAITGYDSKDHSLSNRIYLLYLVIFFSIWGLAVLALLTSAAAKLLLIFSPTQPARIAAWITTLILLAWWLWSLFEAAWRSPIRFSPEDATLICITPVSRTAVVFAWLPGEWINTGITFWGLAITLGFAIAEIVVGGQPIWANLPLYLGAGIRFFVPVVLLQAGMLASVWALGCLRLQGHRQVKYLFLLPAALGVCFGIGILAASANGMIIQQVVYPIFGPLSAGSGLGSFTPGLLIALGWVIVGAGGLYLASDRLNLSRASQETERSAPVLSAALLGDRQVVDTLKLKHRLQNGSPPTRIPGREGEMAIVWKGAIRLRRGFSLNILFEWLIILASSIAALLTPDWGSRSMVILFWMVKVQERTCVEIRSDLGLWSISQPLPFRPFQRLCAYLLPPAGVAVILGWVAIAVGRTLKLGHIPWELFILLPFIVADLAFAASYDVLRQTRADHLLIGSAPSPSMLAVLISASALALIILLFAIFKGGWIGLAVSILTSLLIGYGMVRLCIRSYQRLGR